MKYFFYSTLFFSFSFSILAFETVSANLNITILHTSILSFLPQLKFHDLVLLSKNEVGLKYAIDFTPANQSNFDTLKKLFLARDVPSEIRIREITSIGDQEIIDEWISLNDNLTAKDSEILSASTFNGIHDIEMKEYICQLKKWRNKNGKNAMMNLYKSNCQHFSWYARELNQSPLRLFKLSRPCLQETILLLL